MISTARTVAGGLLLLLLATPAAAGSPPPETFSATLSNPVKPKKFPPFKLGGIDWKCDGTRCRGRGHAISAEGACQELGQKVGEVKNFIGGGKILINCRVPEPAPAPVPKNKPTPTGGAIQAKPVAAAASPSPAPTRPAGSPAGSWTGATGML